MLFDPENDPHEQIDLGTDPAYQTIRDEMQENLLNWTMQRKIRADMSPEQVYDRAEGLNREKRGVLIGFWSEDELPDVVKAVRS